MLILNNKDMYLAADLEEIMDSIERAHILFREEKCFSPDRYSVTHDNKTMLYMPCYADGLIGTKMLAEFPDNPAKGFPYLSGLMIVNQLETGSIEAILNGEVLTALRTGAVGGVAIRHLAHEDSRTVGLVGCGVQGLHQLIYACAVRDIQSIYLYDAFLQDFEPFVSKLKEEISPKEIEISICNSADELLAGSDIVITATQAKEALFANDESLLRGKCFIAIGSWKPDMRELPDAIWNLVDHVYTELPFACEESGDLSQPIRDGLLDSSRVLYMGDFLRDKKSGVQAELGHTRFYKSVGMGVFDLLAAKVIIERARREEIGVDVDW